MDLVQNMQAGGYFNHINLQHSGIPFIDFTHHNYYAGMIKAHGQDHEKVKTDPILDDNYLVLLELVSIRIGIPIKDLNDAPKDFILENQKGLVSSLCDKYCQVRNLTPDQIMSMKCFIRRFKIIDLQAESGRTDSRTVAKR
jgi:hypothetical protein